MDLNIYLIVIILVWNSNGGFAQYFRNHPPFHKPLSIPVAIVYDDPVTSQKPNKKVEVTTFHPKFTALTEVSTEVTKTTTEVTEAPIKVTKHPIEVKTDYTGLTDTFTGETQIFTEVTETVKVLDISTPPTTTRYVTTKLNTVYTDKSRSRGERRNKKVVQKERTLNTSQNEEYLVPVVVVYDNQEKNQRDLNIKQQKLSSRPERRRFSSNTRKVIEKTEGTPRVLNKSRASSVDSSQSTKKLPLHTVKTQEDSTVTVVPKIFPKRTKGKDKIVPIIDSETFVYSDSGNFHYSYEGGDGTKAFERGELKAYKDDLTGEAVVGGFSYKDKDGKDFSLTYTADENGYRPVGAHLPTPPPIPPAIARALKYLATKTTDADYTTESL